MEYLTLNLLVFTFSLPFYSMVDPALNKATVSATFASCINDPFNLDGGSYCYEKTTRIFKFDSEHNKESRKIVDELVESIKKRKGSD